MTCRELIEFLMDYVEGDLPDNQRATFEDHLNRCPPCRSYLDTYRKSVDLTSICYDEDVPPDVPEELIKAILAARKQT